MRGLSPIPSQPYLFCCHLLHICCGVRATRTPVPVADLGGYSFFSLARLRRLTASAMRPGRQDAGPGDCARSDDACKISSWMPSQSGRNRATYSSGARYQRATQRFRMRLSAAGRALMALNQVRSATLQARVARAQGVSLRSAAGACPGAAEGRAGAFGVGPIARTSVSLAQVAPSTHRRSIWLTKWSNQLRSERVKVNIGEASPVGWNS